MINRLSAFLVLALLLSSAFDAHSQCTPDANATGLISPSTDEGLPNGMVGLYYETTITLNIPSDTSYLTFSATVDSAVLESITGLPTGYSFECNPTSCSSPGGSQACVLISGFTDNPAHAKEWTLGGEIKFYARAGANNFVLPYDIEGYSITLEESNGINPAVTKPAPKLSITPNPFTSVSVWQFESQKAQQSEIEVYNLTGAKVLGIPVSIKGGTNTVKFENFDLEPGVYFGSIQVNEFIVSSRFVITD